MLHCQRVYDPRASYLTLSIGLELAKAFLAKKTYKVIAAVRDPATMPDLGEGVVVVKLDAGSKTDASEVG